MMLRRNSTPMNATAAVLRLNHKKVLTEVHEGMSEYLVFTCMRTETKLQNCHLIQNLKLQRNWIYQLLI